VKSWSLRHLRSLLIALQFLTLLPIKLRPPPGDEESGRSLLHYPLVGLLIGLLLAACAWLCADLSSMILSALLLSLWVGSSGGLHLDGLADSADAWMGGYGDRERTLAIMKDPCSGPIAVVVLVLMLLLKFTAIERLISQQALVPLIVIPLLGRTALVALFLTTPYIRPGGLGTLLAKHMPRGAALAVIIGVAVLVMAWPGRTGIPLLFAATVSFVFLRWLMLKRLGGTTGDTAGALLELTETLMLVTAVVFGGV
jgi:adenosylcobinamide-GDP ribazoletransferase